MSDRFERMTMVRESDISLILTRLDKIEDKLCWPEKTFKRIKPHVFQVSTKIGKGLGTIFYKKTGNQGYFQVFKKDSNVYVHPFNPVIILSDYDMQRYETRSTGIKKDALCTLYLLTCYHVLKNEKVTMPYNPTNQTIEFDIKDPSDRLKQFIPNRHNLSCKIHTIVNQDTAIVELQRDLPESMVKQHFLCWDTDFYQGELSDKVFLYSPETEVQWAEGQINDVITSRWFYKASMSAIQGFSGAVVCNGKGIVGIYFADKAVERKIDPPQVSGGKLTQDFAKLGFQLEKQIYGQTYALFINHTGIKEAMEIGQQVSGTFRIVA